MKEVEISMYERVGAPGYEVSIGYVKNGVVLNPTTYVAETFEEAEALARSMKRFVDNGSDASALLAPGSYE